MHWPWGGRDWRVGGAPKSPGPECDTACLKSPGNAHVTNRFAHIRCLRRGRRKPTTFRKTRDIAVRILLGPVESSHSHQPTRLPRPAWATVWHWALGSAYRSATRRMAYLRSDVRSNRPRCSPTRRGRTYGLVLDHDDPFLAVRPSRFRPREWFQRIWLRSRAATIRAPPYGCLDQERCRAACSCYGQG